jgi:peptidoglycan/LPS O-acetylase OafA/YrhL
LLGTAFATLLLLACTHDSLTGRLLSRRGPVWLGTISYSLYLVHYPILMALSPSFLRLRLGGLLTLGLVGLLGVPLVVGCAALFFCCFERPFLRSGPIATVPSAAGQVPAPAADVLSA